MKPQQDGQRAYSQYTPISHPPNDQSTNWKIILWQSFSHKNESSELPSLGVCNQEEEPHNIWLWSPVGPHCRNSTRLGEIKTPLLEGTYRSRETSTQGKSSDFTEAWARPTCWSWKVSWGGREWLWLTVGTRTLVVEVLKSTHWHEPSRRLPFWQ